jgi:hypothetical protein
MRGNFKRQLVQIGQLILQQPYNREINENRCRQIAKDENFKPELVKPIDVSLREDGKMYIIDGRHRVTSLTLRGIETVDATIHIGLTYKEEAMMFVELNDKSKHVTAAQKFKGLLEAEDLDALDIVNILSEYDFYLSFDEKVIPLENDNFGKIQSVKTIQVLYDRLERDMFIRILDVISKTWGGHYHSLKRNILIGVALFIKEYGYEVSDKDIIAKWKNIPAIEIIRDARSNHRMTDNNSFRPYAKELLRIYNSGKTEKNRLPDRLDLTVLDKKSKRVSNENQNESGFEVYSPMSAKSKNNDNTIHFN